MRNYALSYRNGIRCSSFDIDSGGILSDQDEVYVARQEGGGKATECGLLIVFRAFVVPVAISRLIRLLFVSRALVVSAVVSRLLHCGKIWRLGLADKKTGQTSDN